MPHSHPSGEFSITLLEWHLIGGAYLLTFLRHRGQTLIADRIQRYFDVRDQEPDEPPIISESLSSLVSFMVQESNLLPPIIGSDPEGQMEIEWHLRDNGDPGSVWGKGNAWYR